MLAIILSSSAASSLACTGSGSSGTYSEQVFVCHLTPLQVLSMNFSHFSHILLFRLFSFKLILLSLAYLLRIGIFMQVTFYKKKRKKVFPVLRSVLPTKVPGYQDNRSYYEQNTHDKAYCWQLLGNVTYAYRGVF